MNRSLVACLLPLLAISCTPEPTSDVGFDLSTARIVDLTHSLAESSLFWPTSPTRFELEQLSYGHTDAGYFYAANSFCTPEHGGTHLDAPIHFGENRRTVDELPLDQLIAPGVVIDVSRQADADPDYRLQAADVTAWEAEHGEIPEGAIVLLRTGWSRRWPDYASYFGSTVPGDASTLHFPSYGEAAARMLIEERRVGALGVDTASIDYGQSRNFIVHQVAAAAEVPGLENVARLDALPAVGFWVIALPVKLEGGSGGPLRVAALLPGS